MSANKYSPICVPRVAGGAEQSAASVAVQRKSNATLSTPKNVTAATEQEAHAAVTHAFSAMERPCFADAEARTEQSIARNAVAWDIFPALVEDAREASTNATVGTERGMARSAIVATELLTKTATDAMGQENIVIALSVRGTSQSSVRCAREARKCTAATVIMGK